MKKLLIIALLLFLSCAIFSSPSGICVTSDSGTISGVPYTAYECWDDKTEDSCYGYYYEDTTCSEFCDDRPFCRIK